MSDAETFDTRIKFLAFSVLSVFSVVSMPSCGSVERRITVTSSPDNAHVWLNDTDVGYTPLEVDFTWFGTYEVRVYKPGYEPIHENREIHAPLHEQPGIDFIAAMTPFKKSTRIDWHFDLQPANADESSLLERASAARASFTAEQSSSGQ